MSRSVIVTTPRPSIDSLVKRLRIPKARQRELLAIMRETETKAPVAFKVKKATPAPSSRVRPAKAEEGRKRAAAAR
jgi:hypothetical protein